MSPKPYTFALFALFSAAVVAGPVTIKGSDTMVVLNQRWAEDFMKKNPSVKVQVTGGGSGTGLAALQNGTTEIAASSRPIKAAETEKLKGRFKSEPAEIAVAKDGVTVYVHEKNPLAALTMAQIKAIYQGDIDNWSKVGGPNAPIALYSRENSSGTYVFFKEHVLGGADFSAKAQTLPGTAAVVNAVSKEVNGIGYGGAAYATGIKKLKIKADDASEGVESTMDAVKSGKYPLSRSLFFYLKDKPAGDAKAFIDYCLSAEGQADVEKVGYYPVQ